MAVVLVINDDHDVLSLYDAVIREMGHKAVTKTIATSGPETVRDVGADALVVDLERPDEDSYGLRIIEEVRREPELASLPIILCTGAEKEIRPLRGRLETLAVPVIRKPFDVADLEATLRSALRASG